MVQSDKGKQFHAFGIALEMGYFIAVPLVGFAILGAWADAAFNTKPLVLLLSILLAIIISTVLVYRKTREMIEDSEDQSDIAKK